MTTTLKDKEEMVRRAAFPRPSENPVDAPCPRPGTAHNDVDTVAVYPALYDQVRTKAPGPDSINFSALRLLCK